MIYRAFVSLFDRLKEKAQSDCTYVIKASFLEIYNEKVYKSSSYNFLQPSWPIISPERTKNQLVDHDRAVQPPAITLLAWNARSRDVPDRATEVTVHATRIERCHQIVRSRKRLTEGGS